MISYSAPNIDVSGISCQIEVKVDETYKPTDRLGECAVIDDLYFTGSSYAIDCTLEDDTMSDDGTCSKVFSCWPYPSDWKTRNCSYKLDEMKNIKTHITCTNADGISITSAYPDSL